MKKSNLLKLVGGLGFATAGIATALYAIKKVKDIKDLDIDFDLDDDEDYDGEDLDDLDDDEEDEETTEFYDDFPSEDEEDVLTEDDLFEKEESDKDEMDGLTEEEKFERVCGLTPDEVRALLSISHDEEELNKMSLSELSALYAQTC